jgi:hypothetical protein
VTVGRESNSRVCLARFDTSEERGEFVAAVRANRHWTVVLDSADGPDTHFRTVAVCVFRYSMREYRVEYEFGYGYPEDSVRYMIEEGNYSCDCNRSTRIAEKCLEFNGMDCGDEIELVSLVIERRV